MSTQPSPEPVKTEIALKTRFEELFGEFDKLQKRIADRAFEFFRARGGEDGFDLADWLRAETEFLRPIAVDVEKTDAEVVVKAEVPGFDPKDLDVVVEPKLITIRAKREEVTEKTEGEQVQKESSSRELFRRLWLPAEIDPATAIAKLDKGVMTLRLKRATKPEPTKVEVTAA